MKRISFTLLTACSVYLLHAQIPGGAISTYPFCSNANDITSTNHGQVVGTTLTADRFGNANSAYYFNGLPNCYINLGTSSTLKMAEGSISVWARPDGFSNAGSGYLLNPILLTKNQPGSNCYEGYAIGLVTANGVPEFHATITQPFCNQINEIYGTVNYQSWYHLVLTWNYNVSKLYVNGALYMTLTKGFNNSYLSTDSVMVGNSANVQNSRYFLGAIDDLIFYPKPLVPQEVLMLYNDTTLSCGPTGIAGHETHVSMNLYPNPAADVFAINNIPPDGQYTLQMLDVAGRIVQEQSVSAQNNYISVAALSEGTYILILRNEGYSSTGKLVVHR